MPVLLIIIVLLLIICLIPANLNLRFAYNETQTDCEIKLKFLFFKFVIFPKAEAEKKVKKKEKPKKEKPKKEKPKKDIKSTLSLVKDMYRTVLDAVGNILSYVDNHQIAVKTIRISARLGLGDSAATGMATGVAYAFVYNTIGWISRHTKLGSYTVNIEPNFNTKHIDAGVFCVFRSNLLKIIALCVFLVKEALKVIIIFIWRQRKGSK